MAGRRNAAAIAIKVKATRNRTLFVTGSPLPLPPRARRRRVYPTPCGAIVARAHGRGGDPVAARPGRADAAGRVGGYRRAGPDPGDDPDGLRGLRGPPDVRACR